MTCPHVLILNGAIYSRRHISVMFTYCKVAIFYAMILITGNESQLESFRFSLNGFVFKSNFLRCPKIYFINIQSSV